MIKNDEIFQKNKRLEARTAHFGRVLILFLSFVFALSLISGAEFDNVKKYDAVTKEVTLENAFGLPNYLGGYTR